VLNEAASLNRVLTSDWLFHFCLDAKVEQKIKAANKRLKIDSPAKEKQARALG